MNIYKLSLSQQKSRYLFTLIGLMVAGVVMFFSLFYTTSIKQSLVKTIPLKQDEIHLFINEEAYANNPVNYYEKLKNDFEVVIPFVKSQMIYNDSVCSVFGTDIAGKKILVDNSFLDITILNQFVATTSNPKVLVSESLINNTIEKVIEINGIEVEIIGVFKLPYEEKDESFIIFSLEDYARVIDSSIISEESGINKYLIKDYYIKTKLSENDAKNKIIDIYNSVHVLNFISTHNSLLDYEMNNFVLFISIPTIFFILVLVFSVLNIFVSINLTIKERRHYYMILSTLGMRLKHLKQMILFEIFILSFIAAIGSLILGIITSLIVISLTSGLTFVWASWPYLILVMLAIIVIPVIQSIITMQFIKYKHIIN